MNPHAQRIRIDMARPRQYDRKALAAEFTKYIEQTDIPIIARFASNNDVTRELLYQWAEFLTLLKRCTDKKEAALEEMALNGLVNVSMAIFSLKQLGWTDRNESTLRGDPTAPVALNLVGSDVAG